ncbi:benzoate 4-monooxygenase cytochrome-like protein P450 [Aspergillus japonicus CBS 114.51]|uniref:Benzoate 4-monooxygenase cytochrome-like protein P450 n=1 Tax=Aspergillus japonicus CBS 114.51 TaxID=1448312 RepID=A0A8T8WUY1_ASPJA|nr:benzoate 4-monooxygenase cytochrome-like protein P450 [Aspergillus japonicus CBS 114.51]RAH79464.1 benzoate 4-monooxygenase cytochrome-like protein P450 [Aspergillus japonicus CBS 114.51]
MLDHILQSALGAISLSKLLAAILSAAGLSYVIYQVWFHPLAAYPGPFLAKLTDLYSVLHAVRGDRHEDLYRLHQRHGRIVRIGPNRVTILDARALEPIYGHQANVQKSQWYHSFYSVSIFNAIDRNVHARKRRVMSQAFSDQALRGMEPHILTAIREWCLALGDQHSSQTQKSSSSSGWSRPKDMVHMSACLIFDALGEICFGKTFDTTISDENTFFFRMMALNVRILNICGQMPWLRRIGFDQYLRMGTAADRERQIAFSRQQLTARLAATPSTARRDIIYYLQQARDPETGEGYSTQELISESTLLLGAGAETANTALAATWYFLAHHPAVRARLTDRVRAHFPTLEAIVAGPGLAAGQMGYLRACIEESMRLCPPVPMDLPREVLPGGLRVLEWHFPAGTIVGVPTYALHHSPAHFDRPFVYDPSRWVLRGSETADSDAEGVSPAVMARQRAAFAPFSIGPRACIGRNVAMLELEVSVARVLWLYDLRLTPGMEHLGVGHEGEYKMKDNFIVGKEGPILEFRRREGA